MLLCANTINVQRDAGEQFGHFCFRIETQTSASRPVDMQFLYFDFWHSRTQLEQTRADFRGDLVQNISQCGLVLRVALQALLENANDFVNLPLRLLAEQRNNLFLLDQIRIRASFDLNFGL